MIQDDMPIPRRYPLLQLRAAQAVSPQNDDNNPFSSLTGGNKPAIGNASMK
ncbi:MAG: hypothetical protein KBG92_11465 [Spirochaetes bacterium]|jgi:hypothetical protein|nr:hypothetical protein [Spirochaetota bacterium]MBP8988415.1 hypothetical protein [Spirochaetota bacterium]HQL44643.1 hypothetical protein [Spirochaetota bacterium]